ncbi:hypothetical protein LCGC14_0774300 [marine sediment metagenome]|uniref:Uncharacterized protein n=1 Tax=marine sediment metagenome TaxID=412755 RepID=A0A0F9QHC2_9ZZZZ
MKSALKLDDWQQEILDYKGDIILCKGRRIGGTEIFAIKAAERMVSQPGVKIIMVSLVEDQAKLIISVAHEYLVRKCPRLIATGKDKPTLKQIILTNGSSLKVRPVGQTGNAVRGFDGDILGVDEAPWQPAMMWKAARPIISTNDGEIWMWGTPAEDKGYFYEQFNKAYNLKDPNARYKVWYKNSEEVLFNRPITPSWTKKQRDGAIRILAEEKKDMTDVEYGNEYLGKFLSDLRRFFEDDLIKKACTLKRNPTMQGKHYLGVDIGRMWDPSSFEDVCKAGDMYYHVDSETTKKTYTNETQDKIIELDKAINYKKIGIDAGSGSLGVGVFDNLNIIPRISNKLEAMNNRAIALDRDGKKKQTIKKIDYYNNLKAMMQNGEIKLLKDYEVMASLKSIRWEAQDDDDSQSKMTIIGKDSHIVEGLMRAADLAKKDKSLNIWAASKSYGIGDAFD